MSIFEFDIKVGVKHPGAGNVTVRHEFNVFDFELDHTATFSKGNVEYLGGGGTWTPTDLEVVAGIRTNTIEDE